MIVPGRGVRNRASGYLLVIVVVGAALASAHVVEAAATCKCEVQCSFPNASNFNNTNNWPNRPNGNNFNAPFSNNEWDECKGYCRDYVYGLDLQAMAKERNSCGTVECTSSYWLGPRDTQNERAGERRQVQVECPPIPPPPTDCQYAVKFVCGTANPGTFVHPGDYRTTVNVHNPGTAPADTRHKVALADMHQDGPISAFVNTGIGSDGAQFYDCDYFRSLAGNPGLIDGFFVIEARSELDVAAYYTSSNLTRVNAIHVEKYQCRQVPRCHPLRIQLDNPLNWATSAGAAVAVTFASAGAPTAWDTLRSWMSYTNNGTGFSTNPPFFYRLDFCSCPRGTVSVSGDVKSDNDSVGTLTGSPLFTVPGLGNFRPSPFDAAVTFSLLASPFAGSGAINVVVQNPGGSSGLSLTGTLTLSDGYLGRCEP